MPLELVIKRDNWIRGDANADGLVNLSDVVEILQFLFLGSSAPCARAMEVNSDGSLNLADPIALLNHLFRGGVTPAQPYPACGPGEEELPCATIVCR